MLDHLQYFDLSPLARWCAGEESTTYRQKGIGARRRALADPFMKNDAVRGAQDVGMTRTVGRCASRASRLGGYDKTPWARECLGVFKSLFSSLQPTQPAILLVLYSLFARKYAIL